MTGNASEDMGREGPYTMLVAIVEVGVEVPQELKIELLFVYLYSLLYYLQ